MTFALPSLTVILKLVSKFTLSPLLPSLVMRLFIFAADPLIVPTVVAVTSPVVAVLIVFKSFASTVPVSLIATVKFPSKLTLSPVPPSSFSSDMTWATLELDIPSTAVAVTFNPVASPTVFSCAAVAVVDVTVIVSWSVLSVVKSSRSAIFPLEIVPVTTPPAAAKSFA